MQDLVDIFGKPRIYKDVKLYPIKMKNCIEFYQYAGCLTIEKNSIPDVTVIKMSYLDFLFALSKENIDIYRSLYNLLKLILQEQYFDFRFKLNAKNKIELLITNDNNILVDYSLLINKRNEMLSNGENIEIESINKEINELEQSLIVINGKDFDNIRKIILKQNRVKFDNEIMNPEVKKALQEAQEFINKRNKNKQITLEEQIIGYHTSIGTEYEKIENLTIYQFSKGLEMRAHQVNFEVLGTALISGMVSTKGDIPTWLMHIEEKGMYDDVILDKEEYNKLASKKSL